MEKNMAAVALRDPLPGPPSRAPTSGTNGPHPQSTNVGLWGCFGFFLLLHGLMIANWCQASSVAIPTAVGVRSWSRRDVSC